jgi:CRP-like cAMP-binding protein
MIDGLPRSATVMAVRDATLSFLSRAEFEAFAEKHPEVYKSLVKLLARRLRQADTTMNVPGFDFHPSRGFKPTRYSVHAQTGLSCRSGAAGQTVWRWRWSIGAHAGCIRYLESHR